ncbi:uncharacterized protein LOC114903842 [Monodon monoceros]|uniref:uncharacterized protein LOC114903842 n=1 Tax=Monodon monoceros TaxID=40151 RepID=UPI0010F51B50|nr:uncharacterized protein LOC114903842 [Monodon monoceros]
MAPFTTVLTDARGNQGCRLWQEHSQDEEIEAQRGEETGRQEHAASRGRAGTGTQGFRPVPRSCPAWELDNSSPCPPHSTPEGTLGTESWPPSKSQELQSPGALTPLHPPPSPEQSTLGRGNIPAPRRPGGVAAGLPELCRASAAPVQPRGAPARRPPGFCASRVCRRNCTGGILSSLPSPPGHKTEKAWDAVGGADAEQGRRAGAEFSAAPALGRAGSGAHWAPPASLYFFIRN